MKPALALTCILPAAPVHALDCTTDDAKGEAVVVFLEKHYPSAFIMVHGADRDTGLTEVRFFPNTNEPQERDCRGQVRVEDDCRITGAEGTPLNRASREHVFRCTP